MFLRQACISQRKGSLKNKLEEEHKNVHADETAYFEKRSNKK